MRTRLPSLPGTPSIVHVANVRAVEPLQAYGGVNSESTLTVIPDRMSESCCVMGSAVLRVLCALYLVREAGHDELEPLSCGTQTVPMQVSRGRGSLRMSKLPVE